MTANRISKESGEPKLTQPSSSLHRNGEETDPDLRLLLVHVSCLSRKAFFKKTDIN